MKTRTREIGIYLFEELPEDLQEKILEKRRYWNVSDSWWYESELDYWKEKLDQMGFEDAEIRFCGFYSQGDGASFTARCDGQKILNTLFMCQGKNIGDLKRWRLWFELAENGPYINFSVTRHGYNYVHENSVSADIEEDYAGFTNKIEEAFDSKGRKYYTSVFDRKVALLDLQEMFEDLVKSLCQEIYSELEKNYEWYTSDGCLKEGFIDSGEEFEVDMESMELI